jgi:peptide/nickel transport system substrate-binding protein
LLTFDRNGRLVPNLAESWSQPDPLTYKYRLRRGVRFWDGTPLTPADVVFSMSRHISKKVGSESASYYRSVKWIRATGPREVTVKLTTPNPTFRYVPAVEQGFITSKKFLQAHPEDFGRPGVLTMGTGPYRITSYVPDERITLVRNERYWGPKPYIRNITIRIIPDDNTRYLAMQAGEIDGTFTVPLNQINQWEGINSANIHYGKSWGLTFFSFDVSAEPWNDVHVRRAFAHAVDKRGLVGALLRGRGDIATAVPPFVLWSTLQSARETARLYYGGEKKGGVRQYGFSIAKAKAEMARSSHPRGFTATITYPVQRALVARAVEHLAENVKELGVTLNLRPLTTGQWLNQLFAHKNLGLQGVSFTGDYPDPQTFLGLMYHSRDAVANAFNIANYKNQRVDALLDRQQRATTQKERAAAIAEIVRISSRDVPYLPLWYPQNAMAINNRYKFAAFTPIFYGQAWATFITKG